MSLENLIKKTKKLLIMGGLSALIGGCSILKFATDVTDTLAGTAIDTVNAVSPLSSNPTNNPNTQNKCISFYKSFNFYPSEEFQYEKFEYLNTPVTFRILYKNPTPQGAGIQFCYVPFYTALSPYENQLNALYSTCRNIYLEYNKQIVIANDRLIYKGSYNIHSYAPNYVEIIVRNECNPNNTP